MSARARFAHVDLLERAYVSQIQIGRIRLKAASRDSRRAYVEAITYLLEGKNTIASLPAVLMAKHCDLPGQLDLWEKGMAAGSAAIISTLVANPLELVKVSYDERTGMAGSPVNSTMLVGSCMKSESGCKALTIVLDFPPSSTNNRLL